jgi:hypothetical protein
VKTRFQILLFKFNLYRYAKKRIVDDFYEGVLEMSRAAGEADVDPAAHRAKYELPVFCVSAVDFQKVSGLRRGDGAPAVCREAAGTEIPALRRFVHERTLGRRRVTIRRHVEELMRFGDQVSAHLADNDDVNSGELRRRMRAAFEAKQGALPGLLAPRRGALCDSLRRVIADQILPNLRSGATDATQE